MIEKFPLSPEARGIFTEQQLNNIEKGARKQKRDEDIRSGKEVFYNGTEPGEYEKLYKPTDKKIPVGINNDFRTAKKKFDDYKKKREKDIFG